MLLAIFLFIVGLLLLIKGGDLFVDGSCNIAHKFHIPEIIIGATIVSIGTTLPEVMVSATSAVTGHGEMAYGNAIGSIICNTALIAAITITIRPSVVDKKSLITPSIFFFASAIIYIIISYTTGTFSRVIGIILLSIFVIYIFVNLKNVKSGSQNEESSTNSQKNIFKDFLYLIIGGTGIAIGANLLVNNGTIIAQNLGIPESVIAITIIALGTSLPELITAINSLVKGHSSLSLGNIIGANLFNLILVNGVSIALAPFSIPTSNTLFGINISLLIELPLMIITMLLLVIPPLLKGKLYRYQGIALLTLYTAFCIFQFII